jgi:ubiquinone/menaquinone biosynthesis C-methylase UbiE
MSQNTPDQLRKFSDQKHVAGHWNTKSVYIGSSIIRALANFMSLKRQGVDQLAKTLGNKNQEIKILDLGSGNGAYSRWFLGRTPATCIATDWSIEALRSIKKTRCGKVLAVAADIHYLPFKQESFDASFSIDVLGHVASTERVLDELLRVVKPGALQFLHSECADYRRRWPDKALIRKMGRDAGVQADGHVSLMESEVLRALYVRRFRIDSFESPAGMLGWLIGYPEKYRPLFNDAGMFALGLLAAVFGSIKKMPLLGQALRLLNAGTNRLEILLGINGGGSCFAVLRKHRA